MRCRTIPLNEPWPFDRATVRLKVDYNRLSLLPSTIVSARDQYFFKYLNIDGIGIMVVRTEQALNHIESMLVPLGVKYKQKILNKLPGYVLFENPTKFKNGKFQSTLQKKDINGSVLVKQKKQYLNVVPIYSSDDILIFSRDNASREENVFLKNIAALINRIKEDSE